MLLKVEFIKTLNEIYISYEWGVRITGAPLMDFTYVSVGVGPLPMRLGLNLKHAHENWDQHKAVTC